MLTDLPLNRRAGGFVYALDLVSVPTDSRRALAVADSLRAVAGSRGNTVFCVSERDGLPPALAGRLVAGERVPVRFDVVVRPLRGHLNDKNDLY